MENVRPRGTEDQSIKSPSGESLGINSRVRLSKSIRKYPQQYDTGFVAAREWNNYDVASISYMIQDSYLNSNVDVDGIILLLVDRDAEDYTDASSRFYTREYYVLKSQIHDPDTPTYIKAL